MGSALSLRNRVAFGSSFSIYSPDASGSSSLTRNKVSAKFSLLNQFNLGTSISIRGTVRMEGGSILDYVHFGSNLSVRDSMRMGSSVSILSKSQLGAMVF